MTELEVSLVGREAALRLSSRTVILLIAAETRYGLVTGAK